MLEYVAEALKPDDRNHYRPGQVVEEASGNEVYEVVELVDRPEWWRMPFRNGDDFLYLLEDGTGSTKTVYADRLEESELEVLEA